MVVTYEQLCSALSSTYPQLIGGDGEPEETYRRNLATPEPRHSRTRGLQPHRPGGLCPGIPVVSPSTTKSLLALLKH
jgi:hypothetical protein